ncbi:radical SAM protein [Candidatus Woesearchaeota archaeon]|nr:radical SAM protein [Candidatus Woesearchaeota archaeon]
MKTLPIQKEIPKFKGLIKIDRESQIPLIGIIQIGIIDRGSSLLQIRASTACNMKCQFCSTAANSYDIHPYNYEVELFYLIDWVKEVIRLKDNQVNQINIDSVGEPTAYKDIVNLVRECKKIPEIKLVTMQSNGTLLNEELIKKLEKAGLDRINLSVHSLEDQQSKELFGSNNYNLKKILENAKLINKSKIELNLTPVYLPNINDKQISDLIEFAKEINCRISIQKYEIYKYSRKMKKVKEQNWFKFYRKLEELEKKHDYKLKIGPTDFEIYKSKRIPLEFKRGDIITAEVIMPGWIKQEKIAKANNRVITIVDSDAKMGDKIRVKILESKDSIYITKKV